MMVALPMPTALWLVCTAALHCTSCWHSAASVAKRMLHKDNNLPLRLQGSLRMALKLSW
jgi:hypothetical protein